MVQDGPKARMMVVGSLNSTMMRLATTFINDFYSTPPMNTLIAAAEQMTLKELSEPPSSQATPPLSSSEIADLLYRRTRQELAQWSITLNDDDRAAWESWLASPDCVDYLEKASSNRQPS